MAANGRILITGATGFVGSHLVDAMLARGLQVLALVRQTSDVSRLEARGVPQVEGDLTDPSSLARALAGADVVVHLAALTRARTQAEFDRVNAEGTRALVTAIRRAHPRPRRLVYLSSLAAAGPAVDGRPVRRDDPPRPLTAYGRSKLQGERICLAAAADLEVVVVRAPAVYGPRDRDIFTYFRLAARGVLPVPSGPNRPVQMIYGPDLAEALTSAALTGGAAGVYHVAEARAYTWPEVGRHIARAVGRSARVVRVPVPLVRTAAAVGERVAGWTGRAPLLSRDKVRELLASGWLCETEAARRDLAFQARTPLPEGMAETAAWYRAHGWL